MRKAHLLLALAAGLLAAAGLSRAADAKDDKAKIAGTWSVVKAEFDGKEDPEGKDAKLVFEGDKISVKMKDRTEDATFKLDPSQKPRHIDIKEKGDRTIPGIYELDGDSLKICFPRGNDKERPKEFTGKAGSGTMLVTLKRDKP
jgi:uncharacterized protein (TIGR03067 family)